VDNLCSSFALSLGLARDGPHHVLVEINVLDLDVGNLDTPGVGLGIEDLLDIQIQAFAFGEHLVQLMLAQYGP
jgi:hypothetical protein